MYNQTTRKKTSQWKCKLITVEWYCFFLCKGKQGLFLLSRHSPDSVLDDKLSFDKIIVKLMSLVRFSLRQPNQNIEEHTKLGLKLTNWERSAAVHSCIRIWILLWNYCLYCSMLLVYLRKRSPSFVLNTKWLSLSCTVKASVIERFFDLSLDY